MTCETLQLLFAALIDRIYNKKIYQIKYVTLSGIFRISGTANLQH